MKNVIIYTRVSTDEQAREGYSLHHQRDHLLKYCKVLNYKVVMLFKEDYSAKNFDRPEWKKLMEFVKHNKKEIDLILVLRWDRFSRNQSESLQVITHLRKMGIEVNAADQWMDWTQPESKLLLSINLTLPEIENDKISIRTTEGMRKAKMNGIWVGTAPFGYKNARINGDKSSLIPNDKAPLAREAFEMVATGLYTCEEARRAINKKGAKMLKQPFLNMLNNITYTGKIYIPEYKKEESQIVNGIHEAIIPQELFNQVQQVLHGRRRQPKEHCHKSDILPLRGYLICPKCGRNLTGSGSTGRMKIKHFYYHCHQGCSVRFRANEANKAFLIYLNRIKISPQVQNLFEQVMRDIYIERNGDRKKLIAHHEQEISKIRDRLEKAQDLLLENQISTNDYNAIKKRCEEQIASATYEIAELKLTDCDFIKYMTFCLQLMTNIDHFYEISPVAIKQQIISSMFPEKLIFEKEKYRTIKMNEVVSAITRKDNESRKVEKEKVGKIADLSSWALPQGLEPWTP